MMKAQRGFSLVEMAVVIVIGGILLTLGVNTLTSNLANSQRNATQEALKNAKNALLAYFSANHRFPCADTGAGAAGRDGVENVNGAGRCLPLANGLGTLPYRTLGMSQGQALDGYGNFITYRIDNVTSTNPPAYAAATAYVIGNEVTQGGIFYRAIANTTGNAPPNPAFWSQFGAAPHSWADQPAGINQHCQRNAPGGLQVYSALAVQETNRAMVVLISHGQNGLGAWVPNGILVTRNVLPTVAAELANTQLNPAGPNPGYSHYAFSDVTGAAFDDMLEFIDSTQGVTEATGAIKTYTANMGKATICQ